jgi:organic radical activating enzyme
VKSLRLILWDDCNRRCKHCANHGTENVETVDMDTLHEYDEILLTGGEPMLYPRTVRRIVYRIRDKAPNAKIYMYTALVQPIQWFIDVVGAVDGVTLTIHTAKDMQDAQLATAAIIDNLCTHKSYRLNTFVPVDLPGWMARLWKHTSKVWLEDCPLPANETLRRLP